MLKSHTNLISRIIVKGDSSKGEVMKSKMFQLLTNGAKCNARINKYGEIVREGAQIEYGGNDRYISLCRKHFLEGDIGGYLREKIAKENQKI